MRDSKIEWTDHTFNPWWGCTKYSPACDHCYAETWAHRLGKDLWGPLKKRPVASEKLWREVETWNDEAAASGVRKRVFCASMGDICEDRDDLLEPRARLMRLIERTPALDWLLLTKRPENFERFFGVRWAPGGWPRNVIAMATGENQERIDRNVEHLLRCGAHRRGLSLEPLLEPVTLEKWFLRRPVENCGHVGTDGCCEHPDNPTPECHDGVPCPVWRGGDIPRIDWVIVGGESGHGARPLHPEWARQLRRECQDAGASFFFKQWGDWKPIGQLENGEYDRTCARYGKDEDGNTDMFKPLGARFEEVCLQLDGEIRTAWPEGAMLMIRMGKKLAGRTLDGRTWDEFPRDSMPRIA